MKTLRNLLLVMLVAGVVGPAHATDDPPMSKDLAGLQGEWVMVSASADGETMPEEMRQQMKRVCKTNHITVTMGTNLYFEANITLDASKKPKTMDYVMTAGFPVGNKQLGIYELKGDTFKACFGAPGAVRPKDFTSKPGDGHTLSVWKRKKLAPAATDKK